MVPDGFAGVRGPALVVGVLAGFQVVLGVLVATSVTSGLDAGSWPWFARLDRPGSAHTAIRVVLLFGQFVLVWVAVLLVSGLVSWRLRSWRPFLVSGTAMILLDGLMLPYKYVLGRSFPRSGLNDVFVGGLAYPSGHSAHATIAMFLLAAMAGRLWPPLSGRGWWGMRPWTMVLAGTLAVAAGLANIMLSYHWPTDVVGGWTTGMMVFVITHWLQRQGIRSTLDPVSQRRR